MFLLAAIYLTAIMCICGVSIILQMAVLNCYHVYPLREVPGWVKKMQACMSCNVGCSPTEQNNKVYPCSDEKVHVVSTGSRNEGKTLNITQSKDKCGDNKSSGVVENSMSHSDMIINKIKMDEADETLRLEWKELGRLCDRLLFIIFATIHALMILVIFAIMPNT